MSYTDKLAQASALLEEHNKNIPEGEEGRVDVESFKKKLRSQGGTTEDALSECSWEDLEHCGLPRLLAKKVALIFRAKADQEETKFISTKQADRMSLRDLVVNYDPSLKVGSPVTEKLKAIVGSHPVVVLGSDGKVNVDATLTLINEKLDGMEPRTTYEVDGKPQPIYKIGERRQEQFDENPVFKGEALRSDGTCQHTDVSWNDIPTNIRQLVWLVFNDTHNLEPSNNAAHDIIEMIEKDIQTAEQRLRRRFKEASVRLDQLLSDHTPPLLKVRLMVDGRSRKQNNPFYPHKTY